VNCQRFSLTSQLWSACRMMVRELLNRLFAGSERQEPAADPWSATRDEIRRIASPCPICGKQDLSGHAFGEFASETAVEDSKELAHFFDLYRVRQWPHLRQIRKFEGRYNAAILYLFLCANGSCMLAVKNPVELFESDELLHFTVLDDHEIAMIEEMQVETHPL
jgi:hypothetical protein